MGVLFLAGVAVAYWAESAGNPAFAALGVDQAPSALQAGGNMEGKEVRFGIANSALFATVTTDASCGAVNSMHDSFTPLGGLVPLVNIQLGEIIFGGVGSGLYGMLLFAIIAVFVAGPDGRAHAGISRQEDRGQGGEDGDARHPDPAAVDPRLHRASPRWSPPGSPGPPTPARTASARSSTPTPRAPATTAAPSPASRANTLFYNTTLGIAMLIGRFLMIVPMLAIAGSLAAKKIVPRLGRHLPDRRPGLFVGLLVGVILIIGGLTYLPGARARPARRAPVDERRHAFLRRTMDRCHPATARHL